MTNKEAIRVLNMVEAHGLADEAKKLAIKALEERPQGEWIRISAKAFKCKDCNYVTDIKYPYCPICGNKMINDEFGNCSADLRGEEE